MKRTFTIPEIKREEIEKLVAKYQKKANGYGTQMEVEFSKPYGVNVPVRKIDEISQTITTVDTIMVEAFDLTIESEEIRKDGYTVVAKVEHLDGGNVVTAFGGENKSEWSKMDCHCEHCNSKRQRKVTFIVKHESGNEKQIGSTCLKEYCGIDPQAIGYRNELTEILLNDDVDNYDFNRYPVTKAYEPIKVLALAIRIEKKHGYVKSGEPGSNKERITNEIASDYPTEEEILKAEEMAKAISEMEESDSREFLLDNTKNLLNSTYCKASHFGYFAYAPVAFRKYNEELKHRAEREAKHEEETKSSYIGTIGERITCQIKEAKLVTSWETAYGYTYLYKFVDVNGNVLVWFASKFVDEEEMSKTIKATVKDHSERDGVKQTIITRCKIA